MTELGGPLTTFLPMLIGEIEPRWQLVPREGGGVYRQASLGRGEFDEARSYTDGALKEETMSRRPELPDASEIPSMDDDPAFFDPAPEWFVDGLTPLRGEPPEDDDDDLGLRAILERPEALARAWQASGRAKSRRRSRTSSYADKVAR